jgi:hypothetical protein
MFLSGIQAKKFNIPALKKIRGVFYFSNIIKNIFIELVIDSL